MSSTKGSVDDSTVRLQDAATKDQEQTVPPQDSTNEEDIPPTATKDLNKEAALDSSKSSSQPASVPVSSVSQDLAGLQISQGSSDEVTEGKANASSSEPTDEEQNLLNRTISPTPPPPPPKDKKYATSKSVAPADEEKAAEAEREKSQVDETEPERDTGVDEAQEDSKPEIRGILTQFESSQDVQSSESPMTAASSTLPVFQYPPRSSSLGPPTNRDPETATPDESRRTSSAKSPTISRTPSMVSAPPLPDPEPEPDQPFDFHRFLEQLRHRTADPVAKFLRSFLSEFGKKQWMVHEQQKIIGDFLAFITNRMGQCEVWASVSDIEFDNAREGMEKLVMNRLYSQTFSPEIPSLESRRRRGGAAPLGPGRRGQHQEDVERDEVLAQKVRIYGWISEKHLDLKPFNEKGRKFMSLAEKEINKIKSYRAPRDKVICILNCCKVLFGVLRSSQSDQSADAFIPLLIYTVLKANPEHLVSNVQYILRFRNPDKLSGEAGYYMSSLLGAVQFIENLDRTNLTVSDEEFEKNVEAAVSAIAERHQAEPATPSSKPSLNEKSTPSRPEVTARNSGEAVQSSPRRPLGSDDAEENAAVSGLLRTIQKPLSTIGRIFSDDSQTIQPSGPVQTPQLTPRPSGLNVPQAPPAPPPNMAPGVIAAAERQQNTAEVSAARQASAESAEAQRIARAEHQTVVETLSGMFPDLDKDVISDVVRMKQGRVGLAVDACLALTRG